MFSFDHHNSHHLFQDMRLLSSGVFVGSSGFGKDRANDFSYLHQFCQAGQFLDQVEKNRHCRYENSTRSDERFVFFCTVLMPVAQPLTHVVVAHIYFSGAGPTLIVAPLSVVKTWQDQFAHHVEKGALNVFIYHGTSRKSAAELQKYDVVITTYVAQHLFSIKLFLTCVVPISIPSLAIVA